MEENERLDVTDTLSEPAETGEEIPVEDEKTTEDAFIVDGKTLSEEEFAELVYLTIKNDDVEGYEKILEGYPQAGSLKLNMLPLASVAIVCDAEKLSSRFNAEYYSLSKFKEIKAPLDLILKAASVFSMYSDMYNNVHFVEPCEIYLLKGNVSAFSSFISRGGIKTLSASKRAEAIAHELKPDHVIIPAKEENTYKFVKPRSKKKTILTAVIVFLGLIVLSIPTIVMAALKTTVYFYNEGVEFGHQEGFAGAALEIEDPTKNNYTFTGWYVDEDCTELSSGKIDKKHTSLYAGWTITKYTISFDYTGNDAFGNEVAAISGAKNDSLSLPVLSEEGKVFLGWYNKDKRYVSREITESVVLTPKFRDAEIKDGAYVLKDGEELLYLNYLNVDKIILESDIVLSDELLPMYYLSQGGYGGTFDGQGHTITYGGKVMPLFVSLTSTADVGNFKLICGKHIAYDHESNRFGLIALDSSGKIHDVEASLGEPDGIDENGERVDNSLFIYDGTMKLAYVGVLVGGNYGELKDCAINGNVKCSFYNVTSTAKLGGFAGSNTGKIINCINNADISSTIGVGGICGDSLGEIENCENNGQIKFVKTTNLPSSIFFCAGIVINSGNLVTDCVNNGKIIAMAANVKTMQGGIAAVLSEGKIENCTNNGEIFVQANYSKYTSNGGFCASGIVGYAPLNDGSIEIINCINNGKVDGGKNSEGYLAGILAYGEKYSNEADVTSTISKCINKGDVLGSAACAGIAAYGEYLDVELCRNEGTICASAVNTVTPTSAGGIVGEFFYGSLKNCANIGDVSADWKKENKLLEEINSVLDEGETPYENIEQIESLLQNLAGGVLVQAEGTIVENVYSACKVSGKYGYFGTIASIAATTEEDCKFVNCHVLVCEDLVGWREYSPELDENNQYVHVDENGLIFTEKAAENVYSTLVEMYGIADLLGDEFVAKDGSTPIFAYEILE